jgi:hypothetical protein
MTAIRCAGSGLGIDVRARFPAFCGGRILRTRVPRRSARLLLRATLTTKSHSLDELGSASVTVHFL